MRVSVNEPGGELLLPNEATDEIVHILAAIFIHRYHIDLKQNPDKWRRIYSRG